MLTIFETKGEKLPGGFHEISYLWTTQLSCPEEASEAQIKVLATMIMRQMQKVVDRCEQQIIDELKRILTEGS